MVIIILIPIVAMGMIATWLFVDAVVDVIKNKKVVPHD